MPTFGQWLGASAVVVIGIALLEQFDTRLAYAAAVLILLAAFLRYPAAASEIRKLVQGGS